MTYVIGRRAVPEIVLGHRAKGEFNDYFHSRGEVLLPASRKVLFGHGLFGIHCDPEYSAVVDDAVPDPDFERLEPARVVAR